MSTNCKITSKESRLMVEYQEIDTMGIDFELLGEFLCQYINRCQSFLIEGTDGEILWDWEMDLGETESCIEMIKQDYNIDEVVFSDTTARDVICLLQSWIDANKKNKKHLMYPSTLDIHWS